MIVVLADGDAAGTLIDVKTSCPCGGVHEIERIQVPVLRVLDTKLLGYPVAEIHYLIYMPEREPTGEPAQFTFSHEE
jgi:hypothetical protein